MSDRLLHRGPDDSGVWVDENAGVALAHRRLSIVDLSPAGRQPMVSASERFVLTFNGEIYNHADLRRELDSRGQRAWRGHSDTATLLESFDRDGVEQTLQRTVGMFALALWDRRERTLTLARDRIGEKPLYYGWQGDTFLFGSELKALRAHPAFKAEIDRDALLPYVRFGYIPAPYSIYRGICKLPPGCIFRITASTPSGTIPKPQAYWSLHQVATSGLANPFTGTDEEATTELERLLENAVAGQRVADVPLGAFLSGGIDSSTIVALMQKQSATPVRTFTIGYHDARKNEAEYARAIAKHLGTDHTELYASPQDGLEVIPRLATLYDEPFGDSSAIPTYLVSRLARAHVTVALSGDGGDEFFAGYRRYQRTRQLWSTFRRVPRALRQAAATSIRSASAVGLHRILSLLPASKDRPTCDERATQIAMYCAADSMEGFYQTQMSLWKNPAALVRQGVEPTTHFTDKSAWLEAEQLTDRMMYADAMTYLPDDILVKVDRAAMGVSLETRVPILDHRVIEFAWRLPTRMKYRDAEGKWLLRRVLERHVPRDLTDRPKAGFSVPLGNWLRGELRDWAEALLAPRRLAAEGFFSPKVVEGYWRRVVAGNDALYSPIWLILAFQAWLETARNDHPTNPATLTTSEPIRPHSTIAVQPSP
jgi:asparagine synthase (glutamine-hydrolysing)